MTDLTTTDDWLIMWTVAEMSYIKATVNQFRQFIKTWEPLPCPPHPVVCPAGGVHVWTRDSDDRGSWCGCDECGAPCDGPFYPEEETK